jgi:protein subunit release factor A
MALDKISEIDGRSQQKNLSDLTDALNKRKDIKEAEKILEKITDPALREQAETRIKELDEKIKAENLKKSEPQPKLDNTSTGIPQVKTK